MPAMPAHSIADPLAIEGKMLIKSLSIFAYTGKRVQICKIILRLSENFTLLNSEYPASSSWP